MHVSSELSNIFRRGRTNAPMAQCYPCDEERLYRSPKCFSVGRGTTVPQPQDVTTSLFKNRRTASPYSTFEKSSPFNRFPLDKQMQVLKEITPIKIICSNKLKTIM